MPLISQAEAERRLKPFAQSLYGVPRNAWDIYHRLTPAALLLHYKATARATSVHDLMVAEAAKLVSENDEIKAFECLTMRGIIIDGMAIRFKKLDEQSRSRNNVTGQVERFRQQIPLQGFDALHNLELGYVLNHDETDISEIRIACPNNRGVFWAMRLNDGGGEMIIADLFDPIAPRDDDDDEGAEIAPKNTGVVLPFQRLGKNED